MAKNKFQKKDPGRAIQPSEDCFSEHTDPSVGFFITPCTFFKVNMGNPAKCNQMAEGRKEIEIYHFPHCCRQSSLGHGGHLGCVWPPKLMTWLKRKLGLPLTFPKTKFAPRPSSNTSLATSVSCVTYGKAWFSQTP